MGIGSNDVHMKKWGSDGEVGLDGEVEVEPSIPLTIRVLYDPVPETMLSFVSPATSRTSTRTSELCDSHCGFSYVQ